MAPDISNASSSQLQLTAQVGDLDVAYTRAGSGPPLVLVHGLAEDRRTWAPQQRKLTEVTTYAYDLRGHGETTLGQPNRTLRQLGEDLLGFLETVTGPATVVGFSLGGVVVLWAAAKSSTLIEHAVVMGTSSVVGRAARDFYTDRISKAADTASDAFRQALRDDTAAACHASPAQLERVVDARLAAVGDGRGYVNAAYAMAALREDPLTPQLPRIDVAVDVVGATEDAFCPVKAAQIITDALPRSTYHEIASAGHLMNVDQPQAVTDLLRAVLRARS
jgi:3-oxoadipate enol-lactonase